MINKEVIEIKNISEIKSNIVNYDVFDDNIVIATEKNEFFLTKYDIKIEEEIIEKIQTLGRTLTLDELENILDEQFNPTEPDAVWCSDITYIWTFAGFV